VSGVSEYISGVYTEEVRLRRVITPRTPTVRNTPPEISIGV
jgi:hypothetical protein